MVRLDLEPGRICSGGDPGLPPRSDRLTVNSHLLGGKKKKYSLNPFTQRNWVQGDASASLVPNGGPRVALW